VIDLFVEPYSIAFMQRALAAAVMIGIVAPLVGVWVVLRRLAYLGDAMGHGTIAGVAVAYLVGASIVLGALAAALAMALLLGLLMTHPRIRSDSAIAGAEVVLFAGGILLLVIGGGTRVEISHLLFGSVLTVSSGDLLVNLVIVGVIVVALAVLGRDLRDATFDPIGARLSGISVSLIEWALLVMVGGVVVVALQTIGLLMTIAMLVLPATAARLWVRTVIGMSLLGVAIGVGSAFIGLTVAYHAGLPSGAVIAALTAVVLGVSAVATMRRRRTSPAGHLPEAPGSGSSARRHASRGSTSA